MSIIRARILKSDYGTVYVAVDFVDISDKTYINTYLARLAEEVLIHRVMRGVYYKAEYKKCWVNMLLRRSITLHMLLHVI